MDVIRDKVFRYSRITKLTVGNRVSLIMQKAFYECTRLQILEFKGEGDVALTIDPGAFYLTSNITTLRLPARLAEMDLSIFDQFTKLSVIEVEENGVHYSSMDNIICNATGNAILYAPTTLSGEFRIPMGIREIDQNAFANRPALTKVIVPNYINKIGEQAFAECAGITEVVIEGNRSNDLLIDKQAFVNCESLTGITFQGGASTGATTIGESAFEGAKRLSSITYEDGSNVATIGARAFAECVQLKEAYIPATTAIVGDGAFSGCEYVRNVIFAPNGKQVSFGANVFEGYKRLTTVNLPAAIGYFDGSVFAGCDSITEIVVDPGNQNFVTYDNALYTTGYEEILFYPRAKDGDLSKLHPDLKVIGDNVFQGNPKITTVHIGKNIVTIDDYAFENCYNLETVTFEEGGTAMTIGVSAFAKCTKLTSIELPAYTSAIGKSAFESTPLAKFIIPENVTVLHNNVLKNTKITEINIPANVESIGDGAFANTPLVTVTFAEGDKPLTLGTLENADTAGGVFYNTQIKEFVVAVDDDEDEDL